MIKLQFEDNLTPVLNSLAIEAKRGFKRELRHAGVMIRDANVKRLQRGTKLRGGKMKQLSPTTLRLKKSRGSTTVKKPLRQFDNLLNAIRKSEIHVEVKGTSQSVSVNIPKTPHYSGKTIDDLIMAHQAGFKNDQGRSVPARPFWGVTKKTKNEILKHFRKRFQERFGRKKRTVRITPKLLPF